MANNAAVTDTNLNLLDSIDGSMMSNVRNESEFAQFESTTELDNNNKLRTAENKISNEGLNTDSENMELIIDTNCNIDPEIISNSSTSITSTSDASVSDNIINISNHVENIVTNKEATLDLDRNIEQSSFSTLRDAIENLENQKEQERKKFTECIMRLEEEKNQLILEGSHALCISQLEQNEKELKILKQEHVLDLRTINAMKLELDAMKKKCEVANKEKEVTVIRYAKSEMEVIKQKQDLESSEKKLKDLLKDKDALVSKLKSLSGEKARICQMLDNKCMEVTTLQKDVERLKDDVNTKDIKIKWTQNKLRSEMDCHKESESKIENLTRKLQEAHNEAEQAKKDAQDTIKKFYESQENRAYVLDQQLKELQAQLILERHSSEDKGSVTKQLQHEVESLKARNQLYVDENNALSLKVQSLEKEKYVQEQSSHKLKETTEKQSQDVVVLQAKIQELEAAKANLQLDKQNLIVCQNEMSQLRTRNAELEQDIMSCKEREADMLEFTQKVTTKNVRLQSEFSCMEKRAHQLQCEEEPLNRRISELESQIITLQKELEKEKYDRLEEKKVVARHLAEKTAKVESLTSQIEDLKGEAQVNKHKHTTTLRELNRELQHCRKRLEQYEVSDCTSLNHSSRTSSDNSLNDHKTSIIVNNQIEPDKQSLIERIVKLQHLNAKYLEKIDFLEEHAQQLVSELQKKTKVLQSYILREETGALSSSSMDKNKAEVAKHGGIMASMYGSKAMDDTMTLELSLEINRKLQAVLEDTLLKNITLKENIDTLGDEITRLTQRLPKS